MTWSDELAAIAALQHLTEAALLVNQTTPGSHRRETSRASQVQLSPASFSGVVKVRFVSGAPPQQAAARAAPKKF
jgi:hypothetical protein